MRKSQLFIMTVISVITLVIGISCTTTGGATGGGSSEIIVAGSTFSAQEGGKVQMFSDRVASDLMVSYWDNEGHNLTWDVNVPKDGQYKIVIRYCHSRKADVYRSFLIDGKALNPVLAKFAMPPTGGFAKTANDFANFTVMDGAGKPVLITLTAGKHTVTMQNLGADAGEKGSIGLDKFGILTPTADPNILGKPGVELQK
jgi:hypothetical protein